jgi:hypothetical protein
MKMSTIVKCFFVALVATVCCGTAFAQTPDRQVGIGISTSGAHVAYAISPGFHVGTQFGIDMYSSNGVSSNGITFAPFAKFILAGMKDMKPYFWGAFGVQSGGGKTTTGLSLGAGAEYFASRNIGVFGHVSVINVGFDPSYTHIGIVFPQVGIEWFFNQ